MAAGSLALAFALAPMSAMQAQSKPGQTGAGGTWGQTPGQQPAPGTTTTTSTTTTPTNANTQAQVRSDGAFIQEAASANLMEVQLGQIAQTRATNTAVKQFGQRMMNDHTNLENQVATLASSNGITLPRTLNSKHQDQVNRLTRVTGAAFDSAYMNLMVQDHQEDIAKFTTESRSAKSAEARTLATNALPVLQQHLSLATQVRSQLGGNVAIGGDTTSTNVGGQPNHGKQSVSDAEFVRDVTASNTMFVQLADVAQNKAKNTSVKNFAERSKTEFQRIENEWSTMASKQNMKVGGMGKLHQEKVDKVKDASGKNFDKTYMTTMVQQLHDRLNYWQKEGQQTNSAEVRELVNRDLPTMRQLYAQAQQVARNVGVNPEAALKNRTDIASTQDKDKDKDKNK
jgi:putative membrane protein